MAKQKRKDMSSAENFIEISIISQKPGFWKGLGLIVSIFRIP